MDKFGSQKFFETEIGKYHLKWPIFKIEAGLQWLYEEIKHINMISFDNP